MRKFTYLDELPKWVLRYMNLLKDSGKMNPKKIIQNIKFDGQLIKIAYGYNTERGVRRFKISKNGRRFIEAVIEANPERDLFVHVKASLVAILEGYLIESNGIKLVLKRWFESNPAVAKLSEGKRQDLLGSSWEDLTLDYQKMVKGMMLNGESD